MANNCVIDLSKAFDKVNYQLFLFITRYNMKLVKRHFKLKYYIY